MELIYPKLHPVERQDLNYIHEKAKSELAALAGHKVLLIGAGGFLGYYFTLAILAWNDKNQKKIYLTALSNFHSGIPAWLSNLKKRPDLVILRKDITKHVISPKERYDFIIHAASIASPIIYRQHPIETINANVQGLYRVLNYMVKVRKTDFPVKGLLFFSSSEVYGDPPPENIPTSETYNGNVSFRGPRACYDESKRFCETLCVNYSRVYKLPIKIARPFNNYGPGMKINDGRVIADFSRNVISNSDIKMYSHGNDARTFCYVTDAIVGYIKILVRGKPGEAYNIGIEKPEISVRTLAQMMVKIAKAKFNYQGSIKIIKSKDEHYLTDNPKRRCPNIDKAKKDLGYKPEISIDKGLLRTLLWYKEQK